MSKIYDWFEQVHAASFFTGKWKRHRVRNSLENDKSKDKSLKRFSLVSTE